MNSLESGGRGSGIARVVAIALLATVQAANAAPDCPLVLQNTGAAAIHAYRGKVLYIDFWASWCAPCALSFPFMEALQRRYLGQGVQVVAIDMDEKPEDGQRFLAKHPASFAVATGDNADCARRFGVRTMPTSFLVGRDGTIRVTHEGFRSGDGPGLDDSVKQLSAEP